MTLLRNLLPPLNGSKTFLVIFIFFTNLLFAQSKLDYEKGINAFYQKNYTQAISYLEKFVDQKSEYSENALVALVISYFKLNNLPKVSFLINKFEREFPNSSSMPLILEIKLSVGILENSFDVIYHSLVKLNNYEINKDRLEDFSVAFKKINELIGDEKFSELGKSLSNPLLKFSFLKIALEKAIENETYQKIEKIYQELYSTGKSAGILNIRKIGVIIPLTQASGSAENLIKEGIKFAVHRFNNLREKNIELKIYRSNQKALENALIELVKDPEVLCIIGPLYSNQFKSLAVIADKLKIPLISPTATATDISIQSKFIFQFNPTLDIRGYCMASYVIDKLKFNRIAILNSESKTIKPIEDGIRKKLASSKTELVADLKWNENKKQIFSKIREIRKAGSNRDFVIRFNQLLDFETEQKLITLGLEKYKIDSLKEMNSEVSIFQLFGTDAEKICRVNRIPINKRSVSIVENYEIPIYSIDGILITVSDNKLIAEITNEIARQNIVTRIIGNDIWNSIDELNKAYPASNGTIFTSDYFLNLDDPSLQELYREIHAYTNIQPNRTFFYGFETANKILDNWSSDINRLNFYDKLLNDKYYEGFSSDIILNHKAINSSIYILEYKNKKIKKIDRILAN